MQFQGRLAFYLSKKPGIFYSVISMINNFYLEEILAADVNRQLILNYS